VSVDVPEIRVSPATANPVNTPSNDSGARPGEVSEVRTFLLSRGNSALTDRAFHYLMVLCAFSIFAIVGLILWQLLQRSQMSWHAFGFKFFYQSFVDPDSHRVSYWDPVNSQFSALPFIFGTLVSSFLALLLAVPLAIGVAIFLTEMCPKALRGPLAFLTELLAAIPSVVYGLWAVFELVPLLREHVNPALSKTLGWTGFFSDDKIPPG
jgi:phosphate transport system permease protein